ncbi:MAG TPA: FGGY family carbohydrate kinase [Anaeromyxobacteraceae bacterium]|nr:FGGY family carbohydrate kinase [Anaeromyxobacteraceae bacterium]
MPRRNYLAVDLGLTATKAVVFDEAGAELASAAGDTPVLAEGDASTVDMEAVWALAARVIREALERAGPAAAGALAGVGASGHGGGLYPVDAGGRPVRPALTSMDARAQVVVDRWAAEGRSPYAFSRHQPWAGQLLAQARWLREAARADFDRTRWALGAKDWLVFRLAGAASADRTDASNDGLLDLASADYAPDLLARMDLAELRPKLAPVHESAAIVGRVTARAAAETGLPEGLPVIAGMLDLVACAVGTGALDERSASLTAGTWNINCTFDRRLLDVPASVKTSLGPDPGRFVYVESSATSAGNLAWLLARAEELVGPAPGGRAELYARMNAGVAQVPPGSGGVTYLPFIHRAHLAPGVDAAFTGLRAEHGVFHLVRALYEGVAFAHRAHLEVLEAGGLRRERAVLSGGAAASPVWCDVFAGVLDRPIETSDAAQAGARGVAMAVAVGTGGRRSYQEAADAMVRAGRRHVPGTGREAYEEAYGRFRAVAARLGAVAGGG